MTFGERIRELRQSRGMTLRDLAPLVGVGYTYISKVENGKLDFGEYPSDALIRKLSKALETDVEELLILAERVPDRIRDRVLQRPEVFTALADCDDKTLDKVMRQIGRTQQGKRDMTTSERIR